MSYERIDPTLKARRTTRTVPGRQANGHVASFSLLKAPDPAVESGSSDALSKGYLRRRLARIDFQQDLGTTKNGRIGSMLKYFLQRTALGEAHKIPSYIAPNSLKYLEQTNLPITVTGLSIDSAEKKFPHLWITGKIGSKNAG